MTEQMLVNEIKSYLNSQGHFVWRNNSGVTRSSYTDKRGVRSERMWRSGFKGISDIVGISKDGRFIAIECKVGKNTATMFQEQFLHEVKSRGGIAAVVYNLDELIEKTKL